MAPPGRETGRAPPEGPETRVIQDSILPEAQEERGELRSFFFRHVWELASKGREGGNIRSF